MIVGAFFCHVTSLHAGAERHQLAPNSAARQETRPPRALFPNKSNFTVR
jgi:hypothetical protein